MVRDSGSSGLSATADASAGAGRAVLGHGMGRAAGGRYDPLMESSDSKSDTKLTHQAPCE